MQGDIGTPLEARQGFLDRPIMIVLVASCALAILFLGFALAQIFVARPLRTAKPKTPRTLFSGRRFGPVQAGLCSRPSTYSMIPKSVQRFSEKIMLHQIS
jgi:hypothetical protein